MSIAGYVIECGDADKQKRRRKKTETSPQEISYKNLNRL